MSPALKDLIRIATRKSPLALWQAEHVASQLRALYPGIHVELLTMTTRGDKILDAPLAKVGGKGLFVKELESAMLAGEADIAVHSMKDVPMEFPQGLMLAAIGEREDPFDALVSNHFRTLESLPEGAVVGTSSLRRQCQLRALRPDLRIRDLRGNVNTRLAKMDEGHFDAIVLAAAGLKRLGLASRIVELIGAVQLLPAVGQGAIGIECRSDDIEIQQLLAPLNHLPTGFRISAERAMNRRLHGGCQVPIAGFAEIEEGQLHLRGLVGSCDGKHILRAQVQGPQEQSEALGKALGDELLKMGAGAILQDVYGH